MAQVTLTHADHRRLVRLVAERAGILTPLQRETLPDSAGLAAFRTRLNFDTDARTFASRLVRVPRRRRAVPGCELRGWL